MRGGRISHGNFCISSKQFLSSVSTDEKTRLVHASFVTTYMFTGCKLLLFCQGVWVLFSGVFFKKNNTSVQVLLKCVGPTGGQILVLYKNVATDLWVFAHWTDMLKET